MAYQAPLAKSKGQLRDAIGHLPATIFAGRPPSFLNISFDEWYQAGFDSIYRSLDFLETKLGSPKTEKLRDMCLQAQAHYLAKENKWGSLLMQDMGEVLMDKPPFAYPKELWRWD